MEDRLNLEYAYLSIDVEIDTRVQESSSEDSKVDALGLGEDLSFLFFYINQLLLEVIIVEDFWKIISFTFFKMISNSRL